MQFRQIIFLVGFCFSAIHVFAMEGQEQNVQEESMMMQQFNAFGDCVLRCNQCVTACLNHQDHHGHSMDCAPLCRDCADVCAVAGQFLTRESELSQPMNELAVMAAQKCFDKCSTHDDESCRACAEACSNLISLCAKSIGGKK